MRIRYALSLALVLATAACGGGGPKIDTSSDAAFEKSVQEVRNSLPEADRDKFDGALLVLAFKGAMGSAMAGDTAAAAAAMKKELDGLTAEQVIEKAEDATK